MPKTSKEIEAMINDISLCHCDLGYEAKHEENGYKHQRRDEVRQRKWFSEQELKDNLKEAEKRIKILCSTEESSVILMSHKKTERAILKILNDCFGVGK